MTSSKKPTEDPDYDNASPNVMTLRSHVRRHTSALELASNNGRSRVLLSRCLANYSTGSLDKRSEAIAVDMTAVAVDGIELQIQEDKGSELHNDSEATVTLFFDAADVAAIHGYLGVMLDELVRFPRSFEDATVHLAVAGYSFQKSPKEIEADDRATLQAERAVAQRARAAGRSKKAKRAKKRSGASR